MRKRLVTAARHVGVRRDLESLDLGTLATIEVTSKTLTIRRVESALLAGETRGWHASRTGTQIIRLVFDHPLAVKLHSTERP
jgi:hypothetical protein